MIKNEAVSSMMSGSGPSVFGLFDNEFDALCAKNDLLNNGFSAYYCRSVRGEL